MKQAFGLHSCSFHDALLQFWVVACIPHHTLFMMDWILNPMQMICGSLSLPLGWSNGETTNTVWSHAIAVTYIHPTSSPSENEITTKHTNCRHHSLGFAILLSTAIRDPPVLHPSTGSDRPNSRAGGGLISISKALRSPLIK